MSGAGAVLDSKIYAVLHASLMPFLNITSKRIEPGWQMLREHASSAHRKVRVFYERKDP